MENSAFRDQSRVGNGAAYLPGSTTGKLPGQVNRFSIQSDHLAIVFWNIHQFLQLFKDHKKVRSKRRERQEKRK